MCAKKYVKLNPDLTKMRKFKVASLAQRLKPQRHREKDLEGLHRRTDASNGQIDKSSKIRVKVKTVEAAGNPRRSAV